MIILSYIGIVIFCYAALTDIFFCDHVTEKVKPSTYYLGIGLFIAGYLL